MQAAKDKAMKRFMVFLDFYCDAPVREKAHQFLRLQVYTGNCPDYYQYSANAGEEKPQTT